MFLRDTSYDARYGATRVMANSTVAPYLAAIKRGPFTLTNAVYTNASMNSKTLKSGNPNAQDGRSQAHTFNIDVNALKKNHHKYYRHMIPVQPPAEPLPKTKSRMVMNEQRELYRQHKERLANIKCKVNTCLPPPKIKIEGNNMELSYMEMLTALYRKSNNTLRTFTKSPERLAAGRWANASIAREKERNQQEKNKILHKGGGLFDPDAGKSKRSKKAVGKSFDYKIPLHVLNRYEELMDRFNVDMLCRLLRPQIYFDVEVRGTRVHGRLAIQLFTEACPEVVLEFMRVCTLREQRRICFTRTFMPIWLEGKITLDPGHHIEMNNIEHDFEVLNHGVDAGILSFPSRYVRGTARSTLNFTISFKPLSILNGKRIAFGKIRKGLALLESIQEATAHMTKTQDLVAITGCGLL